MPEDAIALEGAAPLMRPKVHDAESVFKVEGLLREARRQRGLAHAPVPAVCLLDPDGDVVRHLRDQHRASRHEGWACYHSELWTAQVGGRTVGIVPWAVGAPYAVLVAEESTHQAASCWCPSRRQSDAAPGCRPRK